MAHGGDDNSLKAVVVAVAVNTLITIGKYTGWFLTGSPALLAEAIHSTADVANQFLLWVGIKKSHKDATPDHPYGWGAARYLWNLKSAMGIFFLGCGVTLYHGFSHLLHPAAEGPSKDPHHIGLIILGVAVVLELYSFWVAFVGINAARGEMSWRDYMNQGDDPTGVGVLLEDAAAVLGVVIAFIGVGLTSLTGNPIFDVLATIIIGLLLGWVAYFLARANGRLLIGAAVHPEEVRRIREALEKDDIVERIVDLKTEILGQGRMRVKCEIDLYEKLLAQRMRESLKDDARRIKEGEEPMKILVEVVGRSVRLTGYEIARLEKVIREVAPTARHIDLELI